MARDGAGVDVELDRVPLREDDLEPWEIMISESQERMVAVVTVPAATRSRPSAASGSSHHAVIGEVTDTGELRAFHDGELVGDIPARLLTDECPRYRVADAAEGDGLALAVRPSPTCGAASGSTSATTSSSARARSGGRASTRPCCGSGRPAAGWPSRWTGRRSESATPSARARSPCSTRRATSPASGGEPIGLTDCLNFGNPEKPEIAWELEQAIEGIAQAAEALGIPVVSGNVSLYNDTDGRSIPPTPVVGCVGLVPDVRRVPQGWRRGDKVSVVRGPSNNLLLDGSRPRRS